MVFSIVMSRQTVQENPGLGLIQKGIQFSEYLLQCWVHRGKTSTYHTIVVI